MGLPGLLGGTLLASRTFGVSGTRLLAYHLNLKDKAAVADLRGFDNTRESLRPKNPKQKHEGVKP